LNLAEQDKRTEGAVELAKTRVASESGTPLQKAAAAKDAEIQG
jgi:hypothetical protein